MKLKEQDKVVNYLLTQMTYIMLAKSPVKDALQEAAQKHENRLRAQLSKEELAPIQIMRDTITSLAKKLMTCNSVEDIQHCHAYIEALIANEVMIAVPDAESGEVVVYERNR